jgi:hypothetical protein
VFAKQIDTARTKILRNLEWHKKNLNNIKKWFKVNKKESTGKTSFK